jgi:hypothetical protein
LGEDSLKSQVFHWKPLFPSTPCSLAFSEGEIFLPWDMEAKKGETVEKRQFTTQILSSYSSYLKLTHGWCMPIISATYEIKIELSKASSGKKLEIPSQQTSLA